LASASSASAARRGQDFALKAETALRVGKVEEAKNWHKSASNAFKEARDALLEGDTNTKQALKLLIDYHREKEKNPGDPKNVPKAPVLSVKPVEINPVSSAVSSTPSLSDAWNAAQDFNDFMQSSVTPPPLPESLAKPSGIAPDWKKGNQSVMMGESYFLVGGETLQPVPTGSGHTSHGASQSKNAPQSPEKLQSANRKLSSEVERLGKEMQQLKSLITKEREDAKLQKDKFWKMFVIVKAALEDAKGSGTVSNHDSDLKALTRLLHIETEDRKKAEAELDELKRSFS